MTVILPLVNAQIRSAVRNEESDQLITLILCSSFLRVSDITEFCKELLAFCSEMVEVVSLQENDLKSNIQKIREGLKPTSDEITANMKSLILVATPNLALEALRHSSMSKIKIENVVLDKVDLLQAMELGSDCIELGKNLIGQRSQETGPSKVVITTTVKDEQDLTSDELVEFK